MKQKDFDKLLRSLQKDNEKTARIIPGTELAMHREGIPTPSIRLNNLLKVGGLPKGGITLIDGEKGAGKTTLALSVLKHYLDDNPDERAVIGDLEASISQSFLLAKGIDPARCTIITPFYIEAFGDVARSLILEGAISAMLVDSIAAAVPKQAFDSSEEKRSIALAARAMSIHLPKMVVPIDAFGVLALYLNQLREKPGVMFGNPEYGPGGKSPEYYATTHLRLHKKAATNVGHTTTCEIMKNKAGAGYPKGRFEMPFRHDVGFDEVEEAYDMGKEVGLVGVEEGKGPATMHFYMPGNTEDECVKVKLGRKRESHIQFLRDNPDLVNYLRGRIVEELNNQDKEA